MRNERVGTGMQGRWNWEWKGARLSESCGDRGRPEENGEGGLREGRWGHEWTLGSPEGTGMEEATEGMGNA